MSEVILEWTPADALHLQRALRMTNEAFAEKLGAAVRTVAKWHANPEMTLKLETQQDLDVLLERSPDAVRERFWAWRDPRPVSVDPDLAEWRSRLAQAPHLRASAAWLGGGDASGVAAMEDRVVRRAAALARGEHRRRAPALAGSEPGRAYVARLQDFYRTRLDGHGFVEVAVDGNCVATSMLAEPRWIGLRTELVGDDRRFSFDATPPPLTAPMAGTTTAAALRLSQVLVDQTRFVDGELYRLTRVKIGPAGMLADFATGSFAQYALTWDLLESELIEAGLIGDLPLRRQLLPDIRSILTPASRLCMGGVLGLTAFARPATNRRPADYTLLVQERGERVINASHRLAVVPKCFHEPSGDPVEDVDIRQSLVRELEEELFGREELDTTREGYARAMPLHPSRLTAPMRWLVEHDALRTELTAFGFNAVSGNFEMPCLVQVSDEGFWELLGGDVVANWEVARLRRVSSMDRDALARLIRDPAWSSEGLYAFVAGLLRLAELDPARVDLPDLELRMTT